MSTLWIVHRNAQHRTALARISGLAASEIVSGAPRESDFADCPGPAAVVLGLEGDFELELEFVHRMRAKLPRCHWILLASAEDANEATRLFELVAPEILESMPTARVLRARIADAFARRRSESLVDRRNRARIADRFSAWLGGIEIPGLLRALDPSLGNLPLLVRGVPGSGRALLARYVDLFRSTGEDSSPLRQSDSTYRGFGASLRIHARDVRDVGDLVQRIANSEPRGGGAMTVWIDEVDILSVSAQNALAQWIALETPPDTAGESSLHWLATAGPSNWQDPLEPALERAFSPLVIEVPALAEEPDALPTFAKEIANDWSRTIGGVPRHLSTSALAELAAYPWQGDRSEVEAVLRATFASTNRDPIEAEDLCFAPGRIDSEESPAPGDIPAPPESAETPIVEVIATLEDDSEVGSPATRADDLEPANWLDASGADPESKAEPTPRDTAAHTTDHGAGSSEWVDESLLLSEASFDLADSDELNVPHEPAVESRPDAPDQSWRRLARSLSHEIRNPLVSIRTFAELLPEHYEDETFRARFADLVGRDVAHIDDVVTRMQNVAENEDAQPEAMDVSAMIEELLEARRERIAQRRLLVLRELERDAPLAWAEPGALRIAIAGLLDRALDSLPERGDLFVATRRIERGAGGDSRLRILLRHHNPEGQSGSVAGLDELRPESNVLEYVLAETVARASGGSLTIDTSDAQESLILLELRTPS
jgi:DNA-binding NtrC family response regulator